jgi:hypothetical protein
MDTQQYYCTVKDKRVVAAEELHREMDVSVVTLVPCRLDFSPSGDGGGYGMGAINDNLKSTLQRGMGTNK